jgi:hypothetical protein
MTTAAAVGYCLANHPYQTIHPGLNAGPDYPRGFTPDGFEIVPVPGVVGAVRRNFVYHRSTLLSDEGVSNSCAQACGEFGKAYSPTGGAPLHQSVGTGGTTIIESGLGDIAALAMVDHDFYLGKEVVAGIWSRGNTWQESDVAQADFCCCTVK